MTELSHGEAWLLELHAMERVPVWWNLLFFVTIVCALPILAICSPLTGILVDIRNSARERHRLLNETDHRALLSASRELMRDCGGQNIADPAHDPRVPPIIRNLGPSYLDISEKELRVELHGGFDHYGFIAFADDVDPGTTWRKLADGLFYYTE